MRNFRDNFETRKRSFISAFSVYIAVPLKDDQKFLGWKWSKMGVASLVTRLKH